MDKIKILNSRSILLFFIALNLVTGAFIVPDYSRSTDEAPEERRSMIALEMYTSAADDMSIAAMLDSGLVQYYGTAITTLFRGIERYFFLNTDHASKVIAHYLYFLCFQISVVCLYFLGNYFFRSEWYSLFVAVLFATQPLLFGHAFINPKDIPIMGIFFLTVVLGFRMVDHWQTAETKMDSEAGAETAGTKIDRQMPRQEWLFLILFLIIFSFIWSGGLIADLVQRLIKTGYLSQGSGLIGKLFSFLTTSGSLEGYQTLGLSRTLSLLRWLYLLVPVGLLILFLFARKNRLFHRYIGLWVFFAAAVWGMAVSTRILSFAAGGMVGLYAVLKLKGRALFPLVIYTLTAMMISFVSWPYLWVHGFAGYFQSLKVFSDYPWGGYVLFNGSNYLPKELPASYLPTSMAIGFTEPVVVLALAGLLIALVLFVRGQADRARMGIVLAWLLLPLAYVVLFHPTIYDGFRHFFFIIPPLFIFAGLAFQLLAEQLKQKHWAVLAALVLLIPGIVGMIRLHPYQMMYYNAFSGGIKGAEGRFHIPFMNSGYKEAMEFISETVPPESKLLFWKEDLFGRVYAGNSYDFGTFYPGDDLKDSGYDYVVVIASALQQMEFSQYPVYYTVTVDEVPIVYVFELIEP